MKKALLLLITILLVIFSGCSADEKQLVNVGALKGPTSIGLSSFIEKAENGEYENEFNYMMYSTADELSAAVASGEIDIALLPSNAAAAIYNKTSAIQVIDINVLGALYVAAEDTLNIDSLDDLSGKTLYLSGKGSTPEYVIRYLLSKNDITDVNFHFCSEPSEVAALLAEDSGAAGLLPQPFATAACLKNDNLEMKLNLSDQWTKVNSESVFITGVAVAAKSFVEENPDAISEFLEAHNDSISYVLENPEDIASYIVDLGIVSNAKVAELAIPDLSLTFITGDKMKSSLSGYYKVLYSMNPKSIGGALPDDDFYYGE